MFRVLGFCGVISTVPGLRGGHRLSSAWKTEGPEGLSDRGWEPAKMDRVIL